jgi:hypothetical protein
MFISKDIKKYALTFLLSSSKLKAALHYGGEVHRLVKNFSPRHGYMRQGMVGWRRCKDNKKMPSS